VRAYGWDKLLAAGQDVSLTRRHRKYFLQQCEALKSQMVGDAQTLLLDTFEVELDNVRQAMSMRLETDEDVQEASRIASSLHQFWIMRSHFSEGRERLGELLSHDATGKTPLIRADALHTAGVLAYLVGDYVAAKSNHQECLAIRRTLGDKAGIANSLNNLGNIFREQGEYDAAQVVFEESLAFRTELGDRNAIASSLNNLGLLAWNIHRFVEAEQHLRQSLSLKQELKDKYGVANALNGLGLVQRDKGDHESAKSHFEESLHIRQELQDRSGIAMSLNNLGMLSQLQNDFETARKLYSDSLSIKLEIADQRGILYSLEMIAGLFVKEAKFLEAAKLWGAAESLRETLGASMPPAEKAIYEADIATARRNVSESEFAEAWSQGRSAPVDQILGM